MKFNKAIFITTMVLGLYCQPGHAFFSLMDTGELLNKGYHRVTGDLQFIENKPIDGLNVNGKFSTGLNQDSDIQGEFGIGKVDFFMAGYWKWIPYPDTSNQPAVGARFGFTFADINGTSTYGLQATPLISKSLDAGSVGEFTPYAGIPLGLQMTNDDTKVTMQFVLGTQYTYPDWRHLHFLVEYGIEIDDAFNHFSLGSSYDF